MALLSDGLYLVFQDIIIQGQLALVQLVLMDIIVQVVFMTIENSGVHLGIIVGQVLLNRLIVMLDIIILYGK